MLHIKPTPYSCRIPAEIDLDLVLTIHQLDNNRRNNQPRTKNPQSQSQKGQEIFKYYEENYLEKDSRNSNPLLSLVPSHWYPVQPGLQPTLTKWINKDRYGEGLPWAVGGDWMICVCSPGRPIWCTTCKRIYHVGR